MANPACNYANLAQLSASTLAYSYLSNTVQNLVQNFLVNQTEVTYNSMRDALNASWNAYKVSPNDGFRILLAIDDGTVAYDSSKGASNTWAKYLVNEINSSNHNTRPEIMVAILGSSGVGLSDRYSRSVGAFEKYQATRLGSSTQSNLGTYRVNLPNFLA
jgi:hypothetical protein